MPPLECGGACGGSLIACSVIGIFHQQTVKVIFFGHAACLGMLISFMRTMSPHLVSNPTCQVHLGATSPSHGYFDRLMLHAHDTFGAYSLQHTTHLASQCTIVNSNIPGHGHVVCLPHLQLPYQFQFSAARLPLGGFEALASILDIYSWFV